MNNMTQEVTNFARFYALFNRMPCKGDRDELKRWTVMQFTKGRTESLREMTAKEYETMCVELENITATDRSIVIKELKRKRSDVLHQMQLYGVDTSNWSIVDKFCLNVRIAGKRFRELDCIELEALYKKLRVMRKKQENK